MHFHYLHYSHYSHYSHHLHYLIFYSSIHRVYHTNLSNILENIVLKNKPEKEKNILEKIFLDRTKTQKATVKALLEEIELREKLDSLKYNFLSRQN